MKPKRLISLLVAVCMMITMLPLSAVTAFAEDTSTEYVDGYEYKYKVMQTVMQPSHNFMALRMAASTASTYPKSWANTTNTL